MPDDVTNEEAIEHLCEIHMRELASVLRIPLTRVGASGQFSDDGTTILIHMFVDGDPIDLDSPAAREVISRVEKLIVASLPN